MKYLSTLNERQLEAVKHTEGYLRVIAGAGSGKTKLLVSRYAYLVKEYGIDAANILCVTFTNKAAGEMKQRIKNLIGEEYDTSLICTYHGLCLRILKGDIEKIFFPKEFQIIDNAMQKSIIGDIYQKFELKLDYASFEKVVKQISRYKAQHPVFGEGEIIGYGKNKNSYKIKFEQLNSDRDISIEFFNKISKQPTKQQGKLQEMKIQDDKDDYEKIDEIKTHTKVEKKTGRSEFGKTNRNNCSTIKVIKG